MINYRFANKEDVGAIKNLLRQNDLPTEGVEQFYKDYIVAENEKLVGAVGLEIYGEAALFRSLVVEKSFRSQKIGKALIERIKAHALLNNVRNLYLLTTTAEAYFLGIGFEASEREKAPPEILNTEEFQSLCPSSAACLKLHIKNKVQHFTKDVLQLKPDVKGAKFWGVALPKTMFTYFEAEPNCRFEKHRHESEQITMVLKGKLFFEIEEDVFCLKAGETITIPSNVPHAVFTKDEKVVAVDAWSPPMEKYQ